MDRTLAWVIFISAALAFGAFEARSLLRQRNTAGAQASGAVRPAETVTARASCVAEQLRLSWPLDGVAEKDWVIANYVDLDPVSSRTRDYSGAVNEAAVTYDGHTGLDIEVPSFREVDLGTPVLASADGVVEETYAESYDRNMSCPKDEKWNFVRLRHANGYQTIYAHLRKHSVFVAVGARVSAGTKLGLVGSSGCSVYPHVHLEVIDCVGQPVDMMKEHMFVSPPQYARSAPTTLMETALIQPAITDVKQIQDPGTGDTHEVALGFLFTVGATISHLHKGDRLTIEFITPSNSLADFRYSVEVDREYLRSTWWGDFKLGQAGSWLAQFKVNGRLLGERTILARGGAGDD
jgi:murein DD-endopeptidase MepM/ murein hydrolase activator NlpD